MSFNNFWSVPQFGPSETQLHVPSTSTTPYNYPWYGPWNLGHVVLSPLSPTSFYSAETPNSWSSSTGYTTSTSAELSSPAYSHTAWSGSFPTSADASAQVILCDHNDDVNTLQQMLRLKPQQFLTEMCRPRFLRLLRDVAPAPSYLRHELLAKIFSERAFVPLAKDRHGNRVAQDIVKEAGSFNNHVFATIASDLVSLTTHKYGYRVVQVALNHLSLLQVHQLVDSFGDSRVTVMMSNPGCIVIHRLADKFGVDVFAPFVEVLLTPHSLCAVATSQFGSHVVIKLLSRLVSVTRSSVDVADDNRLTSRLLDALVDKAAVLVSHEFGNYVISHMFKMKEVEHRRDHIISKAIRGRMLSLSQDKYASHAVEEALCAASDPIMRLLVDEVLHGYETDIKGRDAFDILLYDQYGNYVVQRILNIAIDVLTGKREGDTQWFFSMRRKILSAAPRLENYSSGKKILQLLAPYSLLTVPT